MGFANLHTHSWWSDGLTPVHQLVREAAATVGLEAFALTDHDSLSGVEPLFRATQALRRSGIRMPRPVAGVELSLYEPHLRAVVHMVGLFPWLDSENFGPGLQAINEAIGEHCRRMCLMRGWRDLDQRIEEAYRLNLEGLAARYSSSEEVIRRVHSKLNEHHRSVFAREAKNDDLIRHPPPATYQALISAWEELIPGANRERIALCILRYSGERVSRLAEILMIEDSLGDACARKRAEQMQGCLGRSLTEPDYSPEPLDGLKLLKQANAVTILAHPAVDHFQIGYEEFDRHITEPLIEAGLIGIEVCYPYDPAYRQEAAEHYRNLCIDRGLLISGGTDYHGDGRIGLADLRLDMRDVQPILNWSP